MRKDFQEVQRDSLIDEIVTLIDYAEGEVVTDSDGIGREYSDINVNWADEENVRRRIRSLFLMNDVHFKCEPSVVMRANKIRKFVDYNDRSYFLSFVFGLMSRRMTRSDVCSMIRYAKELRDQKKEEK